ncbi:hypothetical protein RQP46_002244 [Phenoliferia psychrophenolica]
MSSDSSSLPKVRRTGPRSSLSSARRTSLPPVASTSTLAAPRDSLTPAALSSDDDGGEVDPDFRRGGGHNSKRARTSRDDDDRAGTSKGSAKLSKGKGKCKDGKPKIKTEDLKRARLEERQGFRIVSDVSETSDWDSSEEDRKEAAAKKEKDRKGKGKPRAKARKATANTDSSAASDSDGDGSNDSDSEAKERAEHLKGKWRSNKFLRENPAHMSRRRKLLEEKYNPLIRLLDIKIEVIDSDQEKYGARGMSSDSDSDEPSDADVKPKVKREPDKPTLLSHVKAEAEDVKMEESDPEPDTEDEDDTPEIKPKIEPEEEEEVEEEDPLQKRLRIAREKEANKQRAALAEELARKKVEERDALLEKMRAQALAEKLAEPAQDAMDVDGEEEVLTLAEERKRKAQEAAAYPRLVTKGRPKFEVKSSEQDAIGPHVLAPGVEIPSSINKFLRPYQRVGAEFMYKHYAAGKGSINGDDMGLGKTIQVIAFLSAVMGKTGRSKYDSDKRKNHINDFNPKRGEDYPAPSDLSPTCLIACPSSVVHNWAREFKVWGYFDVGVYDGTKEAKRQMLDRFRRGYLDVLLSSIDAVRINAEELTSEDFSIVIIDEAHKVKNPKSQTTIAFHQFATKCRIGLTGTAVQNRLAELWCLLDWANPGAVGTPSQWNDFLNRPLKYAQKVDATDEELALGRTRASALVTLLLPTMFIRRTKDLIKDQLPKKRDQVVLCPLTPLQADVYKRLLKLPEVQIILKAYDPCPCGRLDNHGRPYRLGKCCEPNWTELIFKYISLFQKVSNHLALLYPNREDAPEKVKQEESIMKVAFPNDYRNRRLAALNAEPELCGKWLILTQLLEVWHKNGDKVLIFSMSLKILSFIKALMEETHYSFVSLDGSVLSDQRMGLVDRFNDDPDMFCFVISTRAGGVGLNVVIFDPNWNPSHDLQAMDRAFRMGQRRDVNVYRLIGRGTLEELIYNRQQYKRGLGGLAYEANSEQRMFTGVEGEGRDAHGILWGCKNIFKFNEGQSLTELSITALQIQEIDFAFKNTSLRATEKSPRKKKKAKKGSASSSDEDAKPDLELTDDETTIKRLIGLDGDDGKAATSKAQAEQDAIANILGATVTVISDSTLGGSRVEERRGRHAIKATSKPAPVVKREWNPAERGKKLKASSAPAGDATEVLAPTGMVAARAEMGIPEDVKLSEILASSGFKGVEGVRKLHKELAELSSNGQARRIRKILQAYLDRPSA